MGTQKNSLKTRSKLIEAAGQLFAERGFSGVTVRDIVKKADTHLSALNYHFGSKDGLYEATLEYALRDETISEEEQQALLAMEPLEAIYVLVSEALGHYRKQTADNWYTGLVDRECKKTGQYFEHIVQEIMKPDFVFTAGLIARAAGQPADSKDVKFAVLNMYDQLDGFGLYSHMLDHLAPELCPDGDHEYIVKKIVATTLQAARPLAED